MTEAEARAALRAFVGVGNVEPWIARQVWEATPSGWTVPMALEGWAFRLEPVPNRVSVIASAGSSRPRAAREPGVWIVPRREAGR